MNEGREGSVGLLQEPLSNATISCDDDDDDDDDGAAI
jgi:hypothetical protein